MDSAEFDQFAEEYDTLLRQSIAVTGEGPEYFHEYKVRELARLARRRGVTAGSVLDFGAGVGNSTPYLQRYFPQASLAGADVSARSLEVGEKRFPGVSASVLIADQRIEAADERFGVTFSACVFHHIPQEEHVHWLTELRRVTQPGGMLGIFEHNPLNPLTVKAVNSCPFDANARLIRARELEAKFRAAGWSEPRVTYHLFFPHALAGLRGLESGLGWMPLGAQYSVTAVKG